MVEFGPRRARFFDGATLAARAAAVRRDETSSLEALDRIYRALCAILYNYGPMTGHPGGAISCGRIAIGLWFNGLAFNPEAPRSETNDALVYAAGHKALGCYALLALADEVLSLAAPDLCPGALADRLRLEDLLGFRRNPNTKTPLFKALSSKALDGHPTPATPWVRLATGASGVGLAASVGLAIAAGDVYGDNAPRVHVLEGEGGMTPGRVSEALAAAGTASLSNLNLHVDWNQASIDSDHVCREGTTAGDYVQWSPAELCYLHDWNVIEVNDGASFAQVLAAQRLALELDNRQPTAIIYRTVKGWQYGIEGRKSHGAGHELCSPGFYASVAALLGSAAGQLPQCGAGENRCRLGADRTVLEECYWQTLGLVRARLERDRPLVDDLAARLRNARDRAVTRAQRAPASSPDVAVIYDLATHAADPAPPAHAEGRPETTALKDELGRVLAWLNDASRGALFIAAADLLGSTGVDQAAADFAPGFFNAENNPGARRLSTGGIAEDALSGIISGISSFGHHLGVGASYAAFLAPLSQVSARLHAIGSGAATAVTGAKATPMVLVCAHASLLTGEDGPTHADPQALQILQESFPKGALVTLTPWEPSEVWPLLAAALSSRPAVIAPFVTRPHQPVIDRLALGLPPAAHAKNGMYRLLAARAPNAPAVVLQGCGVTQAFIRDTLPALQAERLDLHVFVVTSAELFAALPELEQQRIYPAVLRRRAMAITEFTLPTTWRFITGEVGRACSLYPFQRGHFLGSGSGAEVMAEAGLDGEGQLLGIRRFVYEL
ncbi:MAG: hypothetical protein HY903_02605 [Deltaproteobacteria bacterium]|nr:hypothetical protein [Deltaproteobacteria bacterium]